MAGYIGSKAVNLSTTGADINGDANIDGDLSFRDNDKAIFGAGSDLSIYHDGSNSYISELGTGDLRLGAVNIRIGDNTSGASYIYATQNAEVTLYHNNSPKLATTSTGVDITGTLTSDGLTVDGNVGIGLTPDTWASNYKALQLGGTFNAISGPNLNHLGNVYWDTSGQFKYTTTGTASRYYQAGDQHIWYNAASGSADAGVSFSERMRIDASGNVGIGTSSPNHKIDVVGSSENLLELTSSGSFGTAINITQNTPSTSILVNSTSTGDIVDLQDNGTTVFIVKDGGNVGIGTSSPSQKLTVGFADNGTDGISFRSSTYANLAKILAENETSSQNGNLQFYTRSGGSVNEAMRLDSSGNIKGSKFASYRDASSAYLDFVDAGTANDANGDVVLSGYYPIIFKTDINQERMRLDRSGNLLVGKSSADFGSSVGFEANANDTVYATRSGGASLTLNRTSSDGDIALFRKDGSTVGSIGNRAGGLYIGSTDGSDAFLAFFSNEVSPSANDGSARDNVIDLGNPSRRFDDIYATNGTIQTSDRNEKQDIAELTDAEQRVAVAAKGLLRKFRWKDKVAEKGDEARTHFGIIAQDLQAAFAAEGLDAGDYAMFISSTWTDEETGEERTRMGVRYSELLAFIIGAL